ncbi:crossover junction endodeoxyribonuclease rusA, partial [Escherichia coli EC1848]
GWR